MLSLSLSLSLGVHKHRIRIAGKLTFEQRDVKMQATCVTLKYLMVYRWRTADEVQAEEKKTYVERRTSFLPLTESYE